MAKLVMAALMIVVWWMLHALQVDEELALGSLHEAKRAVNRAAHAAAQQLDRDRLELGVVAIDEEAAIAAAVAYLQANMKLDADLRPLPGSRWRDGAAIAVIDVVNAGESFPLTYRRPEYGYEIVLERPAVVIVAVVPYPRLFGVLEPIEWEVKAAAQLVY